MSLDVGQVLYGLFLAGAVYGGIRADLKAIHERVKGQEVAVQNAHRRIDDLLIKER
jgi:hypothetical protein